MFSWHLGFATCQEMQQRYGAGLYFLLIHNPSSGAEAIAMELARNGGVTVFTLWALTWTDDEMVVDGPDLASEDVNDVSEEMKGLGIRKEETLSGR